MRNLIYLFIALSTFSGFAQATIELTPRGFQTIEVPRPNRTNEEIIDSSRLWASEYRHEQPTVYEVTDNSLKISAIRDNAFFYRNVGETFRCRVGYTLAVEFTETTCRLTFTVNDIYERNARKEMEIGDYFTPDGRVKEDFEDVKPSLEQTVGNLINSYLDTISG